MSRERTANQNLYLVYFCSDFQASAWAAECALLIHLHGLECSSFLSECFWPCTEWLSLCLECCSVSSECPNFTLCHGVPTKTNFTPVTSVFHTGHRCVNKISWFIPVNFDQCIDTTHPCAQHHSAVCSNYWVVTAHWWAVLEHWLSVWILTLTF